MVSDLTKKNGILYYPMLKQRVVNKRFNTYDEVVNFYK